MFGWQMVLRKIFCTLLLPSSFLWPPTDFLLCTGLGGNDVQLAAEYPENRKRWMGIYLKLNQKKQRPFWGCWAFLHVEFGLWKASHVFFFKVTDSDTWPVIKKQKHSFFGKCTQATSNIPTQPLHTKVLKLNKGRWKMSSGSKRLIIFHV